MFVVNFHESKISTMQQIPAGFAHGPAARGTTRRPCVAAAGTHSILFVEPGQVKEPVQNKCTIWISDLLFNGCFCLGTFIEITLKFLIEGIRLQNNSANIR